MGLGEKKKKEEAMNVQAHMSGPAAATAAQNQAAQNLGAGGGGGGGGVRGFFAADNEMPRSRVLMQEKIYTILSQRLQQQPLDENTRKKFKDIAKRLEEDLLRSAHSKEDYMNLDTLESRLHQLIKRSHMSGPAAAAAQNQAAASTTSQNGSTLVQQMQNLGAGGGGGGGVRGFFAADNEMPRARILMQEKIYTILSQRLQQQPLDENTRKKFKDIAKRLEEDLLRSAHSKEDYMNLDTLESRLHQLIKRSHMNPRTQYPQLVNSSSPVGTMIPTPGMSHSGIQP